MPAQDSLIPFDFYSNQSGLLAPSSFWSLSESEIRELYNGMGPRGLARLIPDFMYGVCVTRAGDIHDHMYKEARNSREKWLADLLLLVNCLTIIEQNRSKFFLLNILRRQRAMLYFHAVADFGKWFIKYKKLDSEE